VDGHYVDKEIDLSLLSEWVENFFAKKGFRTRREMVAKEYRIVSKPTHVHEIIGVTTVLISGNPKDFTVKFFSGSRSDAYIKFGRLTSLVGGGTLFLRGLKSQENEERLERNFWIYIEGMMNSLLKGNYKDRERLVK